MDQTQNKVTEIYKGKFKMKPVRMFDILIESGFTKPHAQEFVQELMDQETLTKADLKGIESKISDVSQGLQALAVRMEAGFGAMQKQIHDQTWRFLGSLTVILAIFKACDIGFHIWTLNKG